MTRLAFEMVGEVVSIPELEEDYMRLRTRSSHFQ
jgi:hypothetical protein